MCAKNILRHVSQLQSFIYLIFFWIFVWTTHNSRQIIRHRATLIRNNSTVRYYKRTVVWWTVMNKNYKKWEQVIFLIDAIYQVLFLRNNSRNLRITLLKSRPWHILIYIYIYVLCIQKNQKSTIQSIPYS